MADLARDTLPDPTTLVVVGNAGFSTEMQVKLFDTAVWSPDWDPLGYAPLATGLVTSAICTNQTLTLYSSTNGYWGTITLSAYVFPGTTNITATCPVKDPFPDVALASNANVTVASNLAVVSNRVSLLSSAYQNTSNVVATAIYTNAIRIVSWDNPSVVSYITVSNNAIVVLPAPPPAP